MNVRSIIRSKPRRLTAPAAAIVATVAALSLVQTAGAYTSYAHGRPGAIRAPRVWGYGAADLQMPSIYVPSMGIRRSLAAPGADQYICVTIKLWDWSALNDFTVVDETDPDCVWVSPGYMVNSAPHTFSGLEAPQGYLVTWVVTWQTSSGTLGRDKLVYKARGDYGCGNDWCSTRRVPRIAGYVLWLGWAS
jgi:hypothetical protein